MKKIFAAVSALCVVSCGGTDGVHVPYDFAGIFGDLKLTAPDFGLIPTDAGTSVDASASKDGSATPHDLAPPHDLTVTYSTTTAHAVDADTFIEGQGVKMTGLIVLALPYGFSSKITTSGDACRYEVWAQDPACVMAPCGLILETTAVINPNGTGQICPFASAVTNPLQSTSRGDKIDVLGTVDDYPHSADDGGAGATVNSHQIVITSLTTISTANALPTPLPVVDTTPSLFTPYTGAGWARYEGTYVKVSASSGKLSTTLATSSSYSDTCTGVTGKTNGSFYAGGAYFADDYASFYIDKDAGALTNCWPTNGSTFSSVSGIVSTSFGGSILPTQPTDFAD